MKWFLGVALLLGATALLFAASPVAPESSYWLLLDVQSGKVIREAATAGFPADAANHPIRPGSTLKPLLLAAAIEGGLDPKQVFYCPAKPITDPPERRCWQAAGHGAVDLVQAVAQSCSAYTRQACAKVDADRYRRLLGDLGLQRGLPAPERFRALGCEAWMGLKPGITATPLELAAAYRAAFTDSPKPLAGREWLRQGLRECCLSGTGKPVRQGQPLLSILGKTGTAETETGKPLGVFIGLTPSDNPRLLIVAVVRGADGPTAAALAGRVLGEVSRTARTSIPSPITWLRSTRSAYRIADRPR